MAGFEDPATRELIGAIKALTDVMRTAAEGESGQRGGGGDGGKGDGKDGILAMAGSAAAAVAAMHGITVAAGSLGAALQNIGGLAGDFGAELQRETTQLRTLTGALGLLTGTAGSVTTALSGFALAGIDVSNSTIDRMVGSELQRQIRLQNTGIRVSDRVGAALPDAMLEQFSQIGAFRTANAIFDAAQSSASIVGGAARGIIGDAALDILDSVGD